MTTPNDQQSTPGTARTDDTRPAKSAPPSIQKGEPVETAQEDVHEILPRTSKDKPAAKASPTAARGNDDVMSQQEKHS